MSQTQTVGKRGRSLAFFDIDGTLTDGFTIVSFADFLCQNGCFGASSLKSIEDDRATYLTGPRREDDYHKFAIDLVDHYAAGLEGQLVEGVHSLSSTFLERALQNQIADYRIHGFASPLVHLLNPVATTIAVSGSPTEPLSALIQYLGFRELNATLIAIDAGRYTGRVERNLAIGESKRQLVSTYLVDGASLSTSFAFGDSVQDVPILEAVGNAFVLGGNLQLQDIGRQRGWSVITPDDDVVALVRDRVASLFGP